MQLSLHLDAALQGNETINQISLSLSLSLSLMSLFAMQAQ